MNTLSYKTISAKKEEVQRKWYVVDAENEIVGRLSTTVAAVLRGKHKADFTPHVDTGDNVIIINAEKVRFTGNKIHQKDYLTYSLYPGGQKSAKAKVVQAKKPHYILEESIKGMLPKTKLGRAQRKKLFIYSGAEHPHQAQKPEVLEIKG